jgi:hypothetical protein
MDKLFSSNNNIDFEYFTKITSESNSDFLIICFYYIFRKIPYIKTILRQFRFEDDDIVSDFIYIIPPSYHILFKLNNDTIENFRRIEINCDEIMEIDEMLSEYNINDESYLSMSFDLELDEDTPKINNIPISLQIRHTVLFAENDIRLLGEVL